MLSTKARASWNCSGLARWVRSPESTTRLGLWRSMNSSTPCDTRGRCGGPKWTSEMWRIVLTPEPGPFPDQLPDELAHVARDLGGQEAGDRAQDLRPVPQGDDEASDRGERHGRHRVRPHQPLPLQLLGQQLVEDRLDAGPAPWCLIIVHEVFHRLSFLP